MGNHKLSSGLKLSTCIFVHLFFRSGILRAILNIMMVVLGLLLSLESVKYLTYITTNNKNPSPIHKNIYIIMYFEFLHLHENSCRTSSVAGFRIIHCTSFSLQPKPTGFRWTTRGCNCGRYHQQPPNLLPESSPIPTTHISHIPKYCEKISTTRNLQNYLHPLTFCFSLFAIFLDS